ncbi:dephospho-CoA kinase [Pseudarthrobacter sp. J1738]|uniref:dephospho-CoA kinase n=1 Tax=unclassified Pseudarthrobacter TaxID=2647000 RepID=UPI003D2813C5
MLRIGLTGGIASGKSAVSHRLAELGAVVVDADELARIAVEPGSQGLAEVTAEFGTGVIAPDGSLDRKALGALIFADEERREKLNAIIHPKVRALAGAAIAAAAPESVVVEDIPLLVETGQASRFDLVIVVDAPEETRIQRMIEHRGMSREEAESRIAAQASREERLAVADVVVENSGTLQDLINNVDAIWQNTIQPRI